MSQSILVVGAGLAGATAALAARKLAGPSARVVVVSGPAGLSASWSGRLDVFGPEGEPRGAEMPWFGPLPKALPQPARVSREERWDALTRRRPWHPYMMLGRSLAQVKAEVEEALALHAAHGPELARLTGPSVLATEGGTASVADGAAPSAVLHGGALLERPLVWLSLPGAIRAPEDRCAQLLEAQLGRSAGSVLVAQAEGEGYAPKPHEAPVALSRALDAGPESAVGKAMLAAASKALASAPAGALVLLPPVLGHSLEVAAQWHKALGAAAGRPVVEMVALEESLHGFRLWRALRAALTKAGVEVVAGRASELALTREGGAVRRAKATVAGKAHEWEVSAVVLATGKFLGGGVRAEAPLRESLLGLPVMLDGELFDNGQPDPTRYLAARPWQDHAVARLGVGLDARGRALGDEGRAWASNLYAAGRLVGGTHPALDGSAQGVDLVTGLCAGRAAAQG